MADALAQWAADLAQLTELDDGALQALEAGLVDAFDAADSGGDVGAMTEIANALDTVHAEIAKRSEAPQPEPVAADGEVKKTAVAVADPAAEGAEVVAEAESIAAEAATTKTDDPVTEAAPVQDDAVVSADEDGSATTSTEPEAQVEGEGAESEAQVEDEASATAETTGGEAVAADDQNDSAAEEAVEQNQQEGTTVASSTVAVPKGREPVVASAAPSVVVAGGDIPGFNSGYEFQNSDEFGSAMAARINAIMRMSGNGGGEKLIVASIRSEAPENRILNFNDPAAAMDKILEVTHPDSITAAGGCCAPLVTRYDLFDCGGVTDRPVRDALAGFQADRGGIRYYPSPSLADINEGVGFWTCQDDEDALQVNGPVKACARIDCPPEQTAELQAVTLCLTFGVLQSRVFPEVAVANNKLAMIAHSRIAESALLAQIKAGSQAITDGGTPLGAVRDILDTIGRVAMYLRDRYRLNGRVPLRAIFPLWVLELLRGDIAWGEPVGDLRSSLSATDAEITQFFSDRNINITWTLDSPDPTTNGGGFFAESTTTLPVWPTSVQWAMFPEGSWLYLDGGSLDLGVIRDSGLVRQNDYMQFSEVFEAAANIGCESFWITSAVNVSGLFNK